MHGGTGNDQVAQSGKTGEGLCTTAQCHTQAGNLGNAAGHQHGLGVVAQTHTVTTSGTQRNDILHCRTDLYTHNIRRCVDTETFIHKQILRQFSGMAIGTRHHHSSGNAAGNFLRVGGTGQHHNGNILPHLLFHHLMKKKQAILFNAFGHQNENSITVEKGGFLYTWGYVAGVKGSDNTVSEGTVTVKNGGTVYEAFQIADWRGGTAASSMINNGNKVFPLSQYYVQNVQVPLIMESGASEQVFTSTSISLVGIQKMPITFIGTGGMFVLGDNTSITKDYNEATDRLTLEITKGSVSLGSVYMELKTSILGGNIKIDSTKYVLPLTNNITIIARSGTTLSANNDVALLPGSEMILEGGSNFNITGGNFYIYDLDEWTYDPTTEEMTAKLNGNTYGGGYCAEFNYVMSAAAYAHDRIKTRTTADLKDAEVQVNGTITVSSGAYVYTTAGSANIYSTGSGKIEFKGAAGTAANTYQAVATTAKRTGVGYCSIPITPAVLQNADGSDPAFITSASGTYNYINGYWQR